MNDLLKKDPADNTNMKYFIIAIVFATSLIPHASAAQLEVMIFFDEESMEPKFEFSRSIYIEYPEGGEFEESLKDKRHVISLTKDHSTHGLNDLIMQLNQNLKSIKSNAIVTDVKITYHSTLQGNEDHAVVDYKIELKPTLEEHIITKAYDKNIVDVNWRGISLEDPVIIETVYGSFDFNNPKSTFDVYVPEISEKLKDVAILKLPLIDASGMLNPSIDKWSSVSEPVLKNPGDISLDAERIIVTHYIKGDCHFTMTCDSIEEIQEIELDKRYTVRVVPSHDSASISLEGFGEISNLNGMEVIHLDLKIPTPPEKSDVTEIPRNIAIGLAVGAIASAVIAFVISDQRRKI